MDGFTIRVACHQDLLKIRTWLEQESQDGIPGSFFCNYNLIEAGQRSGSLLALVRTADALPIAFCLGDDNLDILAVKADCRRHGLGRCLAKYFIDAARKRDVIGLYGQCVPLTSKPFWKSLGFVSVPPPWGGDDKNWVTCPLPHEIPLHNGPLCAVSIRLEGGESEMQPVFRCDALGTNGGFLLARDFVRYVPQPDLQLEICCNGRVVFSNKNKHIDEVGGERRSPWIRVREIITQ